MSATDTSERGLERLICTALTGALRSGCGAGLGGVRLAADPGAAPEEARA